MPYAKPLTLADVDLDYLRARVRVDAKTGCWIWQHAVSGPGWKTGKGYGLVNIRSEGRSFSAHRLAFYITHGRWPQVCRHMCDRSMCCNPAHLQDGTQADNMRDAIKRNTIKRVRGERAPRARLTEAQVLEIRRRYAAGGCTHRSLAAEYDMAHNSIKAIVRRQTWTHI